MRRKGGRFPCPHGSSLCSTPTPESSLPGPPRGMKILSFLYSDLHLPPAQKQHCSVLLSPQGPWTEGDLGQKVPSLWGHHGPLGFPDRKTLGFSLALPTASKVARHCPGDIVAPFPPFCTLGLLDRGELPSRSSERVPAL